MNTLPELVTGQVLLLIAPHAARPAMLALAARMAHNGPLRVLDGGNQFNAYKVAREVRREQLTGGDALNSIALARAFTCFQMEALLAAQTAAPTPLVILDMLATFYDENVPFREREWLLRRCNAHLARLRGQVAVAISARLPRAGQPDGLQLLAMLEEAADRVWQLETPPAFNLQPALFQE
jgi:urease accessory protein UreF